MTLRVRRDADHHERMAELVHRAEEREAVVELPAVLRVASHDEGAPQARVAGALEQVLQVLAPPDHVRGEVRGHVVTERGDILRQIEGRLDPVARRRGNGDGGTGRERLRAIECVRQRDELELRRGDEVAKDGGNLGRDRFRVLPSHAYAPHTFESGNDAFLRSIHSRNSSSTVSLIGGGSYSASIFFQIGFAR